MLRVDVLLLALAVLACAAAGTVVALKSHGRSIRSDEPLQPGPGRLFTASMFCGIVGLVLVFVAVLPGLRALADAL